MIYLVLALGAAAGVFQLLALAAAARHLRRRDPEPRVTPPASILKPVHGLDPNFYEGIRSHALLDWPEYEILFGISDPDDPARPSIERLAAEFPERHIRLVVCTRRAPNGKVGVLADLAAAARYPLLVVNDSDIRVPPDYLARVLAPLEDSGTGMVTCLYRARAAGLPARFEAAAIATDFIPGVLVAPLVGISEFALGSTLAFRAADLNRIGGFAALADYIADDYQLSRRIRDLGLKVVVSRCVVETSLPKSTWIAAWKHQLRWARTIRVSRGGGYLGLPLANATLWAVALAACGWWWAAGALLLLRLAAAGVTTRLVLEDRQWLSSLLLAPMRDLGGLAIWAGGLFGATVVWRDRRLHLSRDGRIVVLPAVSPAEAVAAGGRSRPG